MSKEKQIHCHLFGEKCTHSVEGACAYCVPGQENVRSRMEGVAEKRGLRVGKDCTIIVGWPRLGATTIVGSLMDNTKKRRKPYKAAEIVVKEGKVEASLDFYLR